jgi:uncharacterized membrane protein YfcA
MLITTDIVVREIVNGMWFVVSLYLTGIFTLFLSNEIRTDGWFYYKTNQAAVGLVLYFAGNTIFHGWIWFLLTQARLGLLHGLLADSYLLIILSAVFAFVGAYLSIRMFSEKPRRKRAILCVVLIISILLLWETYS